MGKMQCSPFTMLRISFTSGNVPLFIQAEVLTTILQKGILMIVNLAVEALPFF